MRIKQLIVKINKSQILSELLYTSIWSIIGSVISKGLIFLAWILIGRLLGSSDYGAFGIIRETVVMFTAFAGLGLGITASKFIAEYLENDKEKANRILNLTILFGILAGLIVGTIVFVLSPYIADNMMRRPDFVIELRISSLILFFSSLNGAQIGALQGLQRFKTIALINLWQAILSFPVFFLGAKYGGVRGAIIAFAFYNIIICLFSHNAIRKTTKELQLDLTFKSCLKEKEILFTYSLPAFMSGLMVTPIKWVSDIMLTNTENGFYEMGIFTAAYTFNSIFLMMASTIDAPFLVLLSKNRKNSVNSNLNKINVLLPWYIGLFIILPFLIFPEIGEMVFGNDFSGNKFKWTFIVVLLFTLITMYKQGLARILAVHNMQWLGVISNLVWGITLIITFWLLMDMGAIGLCIGYLCGYVASTIVILPIYYKKGLIPHNTIFSNNSIIIWIFTLGIVSLNFIETNIYERISILLISLMVLVYLFYKSFNSN